MGGSDGRVSVMSLHFDVARHQTLGPTEPWLSETELS